MRSIKEREYDLQRKRAARNEGAAITIPAVADPDRRQRCLADAELFLKTYFPERFYLPFADHHKEIIAEICRRARYGGDQAIAAPRGDGKTEIVTAIIVFIILNCWAKFPIVVGANGELAEEIYNDVRGHFENNELLAADFPEVCHPIRELNGAPGRAIKQHVGGVRTLIEWKARRFVLPHVPGSPYGGVCMRWFGLDSAIRGVRIRGRRPDFVLIDDPETEESAEHEKQIKTRERILGRAIAGLGGPDKSIAKVALCTIQNTKCLAARLTDRKIYPGWNGKRYPFLIQWPERRDMWEEYIHLRNEDQRNGLEHGPNATAYYLGNREQMDAGCVMSNPHRYITELGDDGKTLEHSAIQRAYNFIADHQPDGLAAFMAEMQNDPQQEDEFESSGLSVETVQRHLHRGKRGEFPDDADKRVIAIDLGKRQSHWVDIAWNQEPAAAGRVVNYGVVESYPNSDDPTTIDRAIVNSLMQWRDEVMKLSPVPDLVLIDSGTFTDAPYVFVKQVGIPFYVTKGQDRGRFREQKQTNDRIIGHHWNGIWQPGPKLWLYHLDVDYWKAWCHQRWLTAPRNESGEMQAGSLALWSVNSERSREHMSYAKHICAEEEREEFVPGKGLRRYWHPIHANNHWLDATTMACAGSSMLGISLVSALAEPNAPPANPRPVVPASATQDRFTTHTGQPYLVTER